nr:hypothetical protein Iba_scaffold7976CG0030 [Ipomoea batatas]GME08834.1 hypothetical protein Iba_scaffold8000.4CG1110 [Ipomoea batatas]
MTESATRQKEVVWWQNYYLGPGRSRVQTCSSRETSQMGVSDTRAEGWKESNSRRDGGIGRAWRSRAWWRLEWRTERPGRLAGCPGDSLVDSGEAVNWRIFQIQ